MSPDQPLPSVSLHGRHTEQGGSLTGWRPIETAPPCWRWIETGGSRFLLARFYRSRLDEDSDDLDEWELVWSHVAYLTASGWQLNLAGVHGIHGNASLSLSGATHWMPLPPPPAHPINEEARPTG